MHCPSRVLFMSIPALDSYSSRINESWHVKVINLCIIDRSADGLARTEASRAPDAAVVGMFCSGGIHHRLCAGVISDDDVDLCSRGGVDISACRSQLAVLQSSLPQLVRPK